MTDNKFSNLNIDQILAGFKNKTFSSFELASYYLARIKNDKLNAFISVNEHVLEEAKQADQKIAQDEMALLTGVPIAIKDILLVKGQRATGASKMLANYIAPYTATAVKRLEDQGAIILGKTNCDEFAMGASNENSAFGPVLNPYDTSRVPGGSSGGSAAAVAADLAPIALGTDTGGSIRQPAAFCGLVGLKPSYGRVSRYGSMAMASSLDQIGPMTRSVKDAAYLLQIMAGRDKYDLSASYNTVPDYLNLLKTQDPHKLKVGLPKEYFSDALAPSIKQALDKTIDFLHEQNIVVEKVSLPYTEYALAAYYILMPAELSSNLARFDGLRFGHHESNDLNLDDWKESEIWTDSLWIIPERDKTGKHNGFYHGNFIPQIPHQFILRYTKKNEIVFDPFLGSGTTAAVAKKLGRKWIGVEKDDGYLKAAQTRISRVV